MLLVFLSFIFSFLPFITALGQEPILSFEQCDGCVRFTNPTIVVDDAEWPGVKRAANDLALDFGRVTGKNATVTSQNGSTIARRQSSLQPTILIGTIGKSNSITSLVKSGALNVSQISGQWEAFQTQLLDNNKKSAPMLVIAGNDKRGSIFGTYDVSEQIGVSPFHYWADVVPQQRNSIYVMNKSKTQLSPSVKYRGIFINDEAPSLTGWVYDNFPTGKYGPGYNHDFWSLVFELTLRLRGNYVWPTTWNSMFYVDDPLDPQVADDYGIIMGTSHTEPMTRQTKEQQLFLGGPWDWSTNEQNVTQFFEQGANRSQTFETLYTMGMRGNGDAASPTLNASSLEDILQVQQRILGDTLTDRPLSDVPQMWCLYSEVGTYYQDGLKVPDEVTILWTDDNWGNARRLPVGSEVGRQAGSGLYYHIDYVGGPRDYKWINTISLPKTWQQLRAAYERDARQIWILNVGHLKGYEEPIQMYMDMAYDISKFEDPTSIQTWLTSWATREFGSAAANATADIMTRYSHLVGRRKYELLDQNVYSPVDYNELDNVAQTWQTLVNDAIAIYQALPAAQQPSFWEIALHPTTAGTNLHQLYRAVTLNNLYALERRTSTNAWAQQALSFFNQDHILTVTWNNLLNGKWRHLVDQTHIGYSYWQQPMRNTLPPLSYVQTLETALPGQLGVSVEGSNASVPGDDQFHDLSSETLTLPPFDPYMPNPSRWLDVYSRGISPFDFTITTNASYVHLSSSTGHIDPSTNASDTRINITIDWTAAPSGSSMALANITIPDTGPTTYGTQYSAPQVRIPINKTTVPDAFHGFVESDRTIAIEPEHWDSYTPSSTANLTVLPAFGRGISGITLRPATAPSQTPPDAPMLTYDFYAFTNANASVTVWMADSLNTDPDRPMKYAIAVDAETPRIVQPVPTTPLGTFPANWNNMVIGALATNMTMHAVRPGAHELKLWILEPGLVVERVVVDLGGVRGSYLGPDESVRV